MKCTGFLGIVVGVSMGLFIAGCGGGRDYLASSNKLSSINDAESSAQFASEANADVKLAKKKKKNKKKKTPPVINSASSSPTTLEILGGQVTVTTNVTSSNPNVSVTAQALTAGFTPIVTTLNPTGGGNFTGSLSIPGSFAGVTRVYQVNVVANDGTNAPVTAAAGTVTVAVSGGGSGPPPPPFFN
jgi:hypothetical protein